MAEEKDRVNDRELAWEEVRTEHLIRDRWIDLRRSAFRYPDGKIWEPYYNYTRRDYAIVVASDEEGNYLCVRQFRQGIRKVTTEFPAGGLEREGAAVFSGSTAEEALAAAKRELREETGYESDQWTYLMRVPACASLSDNYAFLFAAENCRKITEQKLDEMELLQVEKHTAAEIEEMIRTEEFPQTDHILAWMLWNKGAF
jgi:ADP-ribose pyrophosphatase